MIRSLKSLNGFAVLFQDIVIQPDDEIRIRIVGTRVDAKDIVRPLCPNHFKYFFFLHQAYIYITYIKRNSSKSKLMGGGCAIYV